MVLGGFGHHSATVEDSRRVVRFHGDYFNIGFDKVVVGWLWIGFLVGVGVLWRGSWRKRWWDKEVLFLPRIRLKVVMYKGDEVWLGSSSQRL